MQNPKDAKQAAAYVIERLGRPDPDAVGLIAGTGLSGLIPHGADAASLPYADIPGFPRSTVPGHAGRLTRPRIGGRDVLALGGRFHLYEGYTPAEVVMGVRVLALCGARVLIVTNAAGAINPRFRAGELMLVTDHLNLTGQNPLTGPNDETLGPRFPDMCGAYSPRLGELAEKAALARGLRLNRGVYAGLPGPSMETPAETRMLRILGADAVGMSTVLEVIAARHMGLEVLCLSCLTNLNLPDSMAPVRLEDVLDVAGRAAAGLSGLLAEVIPAC